MFEVKIFTLYPDLFPGPLDILDIIKRQRKKKFGALKVINIRDYAKDNHRYSRRHSFWWRKWNAFTS